MYKLCLAASIFLWGMFSYAETLFVDDFENGLGKWSGKNNTVPTAKIVDDPINSGRGKVVTFTKKVIEGDIYTKTVISNLPTNKPYILEFDYLGIPVRKSREGNGGYIGYSKNTNPGAGPSNHRWVGGTKGNYSIYRGDQYQFLKDNGKWNHYKVDLSATDFPDFVLMLEDYLYARGVAGDAYFDNIVLTDARGPSDFKLTVDKKGDGQVNSVPDGIDCNTDCEESYTDGTDVTLIVTPNTGSTFVNWQGDCTGDNNIVVTVNKNKTCTAIFEKQFQLTVNKTGNGKVYNPSQLINCGTDCNEFYNDGSTVNLIAVPAKGSTFTGWNGDCVGNENTTITMNANKTCTAIFDKQFQLKVTKKGNGQVNSVPDGIDCNTDCEESYTDGTEVTLIVTPNAGSSFVNWQGDCTGDNNIIVTMDKNKTCTAIFKKQFKLTVNKIGNGKVHNPSQVINCGTDCNEFYNDGSIVNLIATPDKDSTFIGWIGDCAGDENFNLTIDANKTCTAIFKKRFKLTVSKIGNGKVNNPSQVINCGTDCDEIYNDGSIVNLIATPDKNSSFAGWTGDCIGNENTSVTIDANKTCTAKFTKQFKLAVNKIGNGKVHNPSKTINCGTDCNEFYNDGSTVNLIATPDKNSSFAGWTGDCAGNENTTITIDENKNCTAKFTKQFQLIVDKIGNGKVNNPSQVINCGTDCNEFYNDGSTVNLIATPEKGSSFTGWIGDCKGNEKTSITIDANKTCTAKFTNQFQLTVSKTGDGKVHNPSQVINCGTDCNEIYNDGSTVNLIATPDKGSIFVGWIGDCKGNENFTITIDRDKNCTAVFDKNFQLIVDIIGNGKVRSDTQGINCGMFCNEFYNDGSTVTLIATPDKGSTFTGWIGDCTGNKNATITINTDKNCTAKFTKQFQLTVNKIGDGKVHNPSQVINCGPDCNETYNEGSTVNLIATPDKDSIFSGWTGDCKGDKSLTITIDANKNCTAVFGKRFQLTVDKIGNGKIDSKTPGISCGIDCNEIYDGDSVVTLIAIPDKNSTFTGWTGDCKGNQNSTITINANKSCTAVFDEQFQLTVNKIGKGRIHSSSSEINCGTDCNEIYNGGSKVTLIATPDKNATFIGWQGDCDGNDNVSITIDTNKTCTAVFKQKFHLIVNKTGNGKIKSKTPGINCGMFCNEFYNDGSTVTLIATPDKGSTFIGWQGDCTGDKNSTITIDANKNCTAVFEKRFQLTVSKIGNGKIHSTNEKINCGTDCNEIYKDGSIVNLTATPDANSSFTGWQDDCNIQKPVNKPTTVMGRFKNLFGFGEDTNDSAVNDTNPSITVTMDANKNCIAKFTKKIPLTVNKSGNGNGLVKSTKPGINCGTNCKQDYTSNEQLKLTATADSNSVFIGWTKDCNGNNPVITVTMDMAKTCTANFTAKFPLKVNKIGDGNGQIVTSQIDCGINCTSNYIDGTELMLTATPDENSIFTGWQDACTGTDSSTNVVINKAKTCTAVFEKVEYCKELPKAKVGITFSAKFPDKPGKYYIIPAEVAESCLKIIESDTVLIIEKVPECQPKPSGK